MVNSAKGASSPVAEPFAGAERNAQPPSDVYKRQVHECLRGLLAAIAAAAVYEDELALVGQCVLGGSRHGVVGDEGCLLYTSRCV